MLLGHGGVEIMKAVYLTFQFFSPFQHMTGLHFPVPLEGDFMICSGP